jgi:tetratricopeptide (TPR) repeat protein
MSVESSPAPKAVFLSYASQDADAARRICESLRAGGVEVWFDADGGLEHGDEWDAKIRRQIKECVLFIPVISANTQARHEGYFRIEWELGAQRAMGIASGVPFILPVVIDDTREPDALVPDRFRAVQWTRLRGGEIPPDVQQRFLKLWSHRTGVLKAEAPIVEPASSRLKEAANKMPALRQASRRMPVAAWIGAAVTIAAVIAFVALRPKPSAPHVTPPALVEKSAAVARPSPTLSPARELIEKARALYEPWDLATKDDLVMADQFLKRATELDPTDGEVWANQALVSCAFVGMTATPEDRRVEMRLQAERAVKLAPNSDNARFARAFAIRLEGKPGAWEAAIPILRDIVARNPENRLMLRGLGYPLTSRAETREEGLALLRRAAALPGGDAVAEFNIGQSYMYGGRNPREALAAYNRSLKLAPSAHRTHSSKIELFLRWAGDLPAARQALREVPEAALREDRVIGIATRVLLAAGEPDYALRLLSSTYPYLNSSFFTGPTPYLKGLAHRQANRPTAAATEWNVALKEIQRRLDATPTARAELALKAATLAHLGRHAEAAETLELYQQLVPANAQDDQRILIVKTLLGRIPEVVAAMEAGLLRSHSQRAYMAALILFDPELAALRAHPNYAPLAEKARAAYADVQLK